MEQEKRHLGDATKNNNKKSTRQSVSLDPFNFEFIYLSLMTKGSLRPGTDLAF